MVSICRNNSVNSFFGLPPPLEEDRSSQVFHQTLCVPSSPQTPTTFPPNNPNSILNPLKPIRAIESFDKKPLKSSGKNDGEKRKSGNINLMSCTENLGLESSNEMISSFADLVILKNKNNNSCRRFSDNEESSSSSSNSSSCVLRRRNKRLSKIAFPPPLTTLDENGRRNFMLKSVRKDGRLQIAEVKIERPEILRATRENGRLRLHLFQSVSSSDDDDGVHDHDHDHDEEESEEKEWKVPASGGLRRCYDHQHVWGPHQHRCVTTI